MICLFQLLKIFYVDHVLHIKVWVCLLSLLSEFRFKSLKFQPALSQREQILNLLLKSYLPFFTFTCIEINVKNISVFHAIFES
jgi:hypothetical protein